MVARRPLLVSIFVPFLIARAGHGASPQAERRDSYFMIRVIDDETGRGVPLVEFRTASWSRYYSDSYGIIAFDEPSLMNQQVYFEVFSHGYECPVADLSGDRGVVLHPAPGDSALVRVRRTNIAERLYRITGQDIYGASARLGYPIPIKRQGLNGKVCGQDTFIEALYKKKIYWFWGDTGGPAHFNGKASGATSELPGHGGLDPGVGIDLGYFVDSTGFSKPMCPIQGRGLVWIDWLVTVPDGMGSDRLYAKFSRTKTLSEDYERGIAVFNDSLEIFEKVVRVDAWLDKVHSSGHPVRASVENDEYIYIIDRYGFERVLADSQHITDAASYEHFTCLTAGVKFDSTNATLDRTSNGHLVYAWKRDTDALSRKQQAQLVSSGKMKQLECLWQPQDVESGRPVAIDPASVFWNNNRKCWVMLAYEYCGSVWYFEGDTPVGPWVFGQRIVTHENYDFYNVGQHPLFDQDDGRVIYFEGTYTTGFSGNTDPTPLYDYNQIMYRLSLDDSRLSLPAPVYRVKDVQGQERYLMRTAVDSLGLWDRILEIPFYAIPPDRIADQVIPIYFHAGKNGGKFSAEQTVRQSDRLSFCALPAVSQPVAAADPITGTWQFVVKLADGSVDSGQIDLTLRGRTVSGKEVVKGVYRDGKLDLHLRDLGIILSGTLQEGRLNGVLRKSDSTTGGTWIGYRVKLLLEKSACSAVVPLYEYCDKNTGQWYYSVDTELGDSTLIRSEEPVCRVWKNPSSLLLLDYTAKPVAVAVRQFELQRLLLN